jgi:hypothetical protein
VPGILNLYELRPHMWVVHKERVETALILGHPPLRLVIADQYQIWT